MILKRSDQNYKDDELRIITKVDFLIKKEIIMHSDLVFYHNSQYIKHLNMISLSDRHARSDANG